MDRFCLVGSLSIFSYLPTPYFSLSFLGEPPATCKGTQAGLLRDPPGVTLRTPTMSKIHLGNKSSVLVKPWVTVVLTAGLCMYIGTKNGFIF